MAFMVIVGTVIGSGFLSGKEIVVFFTRFGKMSYFCIFLAFLLFWGLFYFFLKHGKSATERLGQSRFAFALHLLICTILSSAMFAGIFSLTSLWSTALRVVVMLVTVILSGVVAVKGSRALENLNLALVPVMVVFLLVNLINLFAFKAGSLFVGSFAPLSIFYCFLYVILNTSNSAIVISSYSDLSDKQKVQVSFFSALALFVILLFSNLVLLQNSYSFSADMPLLQLTSGLKKGIMSIIICFGCLTTLFSLVYASSKSLKRVSINKSFSILLCVILPFCFSFLGFGVIVSNLYPLTSTLGIFLLCDLFLYPALKKINYRIHRRRKNAKKHN